MHVCGQGTRLVLQPETQREQLALYRLFSRLLTSWFTADIAEYGDLDHNLAERRTRLGSFAPGSRALVIPDAPAMPLTEDDQ
ncbi:hypothetical protein BRC71_06285 [Halobacteriales archaeon QH_7_65_31]|nr:MAG: hypothetical protein BRC71_06285 [Halobacteriales archaeon QH_7_65_31]